MKSRAERKLEKAVRRAEQAERNHVNEVHECHPPRASRFGHNWFIEPQNKNHAGSTWTCPDCQQGWIMVWDFWLVWKKN